MKHNVLIVAILSSLSMLISFVACNNNKKIKEQNKKEVTETTTNDTFIYSYGDASVPPQYHRSYTITVTAAAAHLVVDSYGDVKAKDSLPLTESVYAGFVKGLNGLQLKNKKDLESEGCTGGTTDKLILYAGTSREIKGYTYYCANKEFGNLEGNVAVAGDLFKALIPGLQQKIDSTR